MTPEDFNEWVRDETTKEVMRWLREERATAVANLAEGGTISGQDTAILTSRQVGLIEGLNHAINIKLDETEGVLYYD